MVLLGIEAAAKVAGAALYADGHIIAEHRLEGTLTHSETLMPMMDAVLKEAGRGPEALTYIALTTGPGSFTGLRIGAATAKGLALGLGIPLIPLSTLEVLAYGAGSSITSMVCVPIMDARRGQVYAAAYHNRQQILEPQAIAAQELAEQLKALHQPCLFMGDAAELYHPLFQKALLDDYHLAPSHLRELRAGASAALAAEKVEKGQAVLVKGSELTLTYLRKPQAEREREAALHAH